MAIRPVFVVDEGKDSLIKEENITEFKELCGKNNYDKKLDLYS